MRWTLYLAHSRETFKLTCLDSVQPISHQWSYVGTNEKYLPFHPSLNTPQYPKYASLFRNMNFVLTILSSYSSIQVCNKGENAIQVRRKRQSCPGDSYLKMKYFTPTAIKIQTTHFVSLSKYVSCTWENTRCTFNSYLFVTWMKT